ncbi:hypothetical protein DFP93_105174 [Aneurinibacillus soli]|uniref:Uncharacterized protein n=1 Tax=Aneurinibacillus soli TaxID=1500254 RepID=A0A0U5AXX3_9BACL|nr:hypothetical protein [Aneurinibacillus soli]PYE62219.1 hypothetical protein DFP93_105174 [Aneurinibacillus soli]BAU28593.1 hypothetical protein CB4_02768 [Aneurinibacillus soli]
MKKYMLLFSLVCMSFFTGCDQKEIIHTQGPEKQVTTSEATLHKVDSMSEDSSSNGRKTVSNITQDNYISASQAVGGIGSVEYSHYGNFKYDGRAYIKNVGNREFTYKTYTASGKLVHEEDLQPGKNATLHFLQSELGRDLCDGNGKVTIATSDGGTAKAYFRYIVLGTTKN